MEATNLQPSAASALTAVAKAAEQNNNGNQAQKSQNTLQHPTNTILTHQSQGSHPEIPNLNHYSGQSVNHNQTLPIPPEHLNSHSNSLSTNISNTISTNIHNNLPNIESLPQQPTILDQNMPIVSQISPPGGFWQPQQTQNANLNNTSLTNQPPTAMNHQPTQHAAPQNQVSDAQNWYGSGGISPQIAASYGNYSVFEKNIEMWYFCHFNVVSFRCETKEKVLDIIHSC